MDSSNIFQQLCAGTHFNFRKYRKDAYKLQISKKHTEHDCHSGPVNISQEQHNITDGDDHHEHQPYKPDVEEEEEECINLLSSYPSSSSGSVKGANHKKQLSSIKAEALRQEKVNSVRKSAKIHVYGGDIPDPIREFGDLSHRFHIDQTLLDNISSSEIDYHTPTPIQMQAIPVMLNRRELLACAPTGSGKTAAFIIPILHHLHKPKKEGFRAIVLAPTRELAKQTHREFCRLSSGMGFRIHVLNNLTLAVKKYQASLRYDILISTPKKLLMLLKHNPPVLDLSHLSWLIIDESDKLFEAGSRGFRTQLAHIYNCCSENNSNLRRAMFSATCTSDVETWCRDNLDNIITVTVGARNSAVDVVKQELVFVGSESGKLYTLRDILNKGFTPPVLIFVQSKDRGKQLHSELLYDGFNVDIIHADRPQQERDEVVSEFRSGVTWVLICTDLMARGMDFKGVNLVVNFDFPTSTISYIHRIGRSGRAGREGRAVTFFTHDDIPSLRCIANVMRRSGCHIPDYMLTLRKPSKKAQRKLRSHPTDRDPITTKPADNVKGSTDANATGKTMKRKLNVKDSGSSSRTLKSKKLSTSELRRKEKYRRFKQKMKERKKAKQD